MFADAWDAVYCFMLRRDQAFARLCAGFSSPLVEQTPETIEPAEAENKSDVIAKVHLEIIAALQECQLALNALLDLTQAQQVIVALTIQCDETISTHKLVSPPHHWFRLQRQLLKIEHGGNYFYHCLDRLIQNPRGNYFALQVFYFCLKQGFRGQYYDQEHEIVRYLKQLVPLIDHKLQYSPRPVPETENIQKMYALASPVT